MTVLVFFLIQQVNWKEVWGYLKNMRPFFLFLSVCFYLVGIIISARKWQVLSIFKNFQKSYYFYFKTYLLGTFLNNFFPSFIGGDAYRIHSLGKFDKRFKDSSLTVVIDRISGLLGIVVLAAFFGILNYKNIINNQTVFWLVIAMMIVSIAFFMGALFFNSRIAQILINYFPNKIKIFIKQLGEFRRKKIFFKTINYSFLFVFVGVTLANYMLFLALNIKLSFFDFLSVTFLANIIASIPISVGNIGVKELAYILLFGIFGVDTSAAVTVVVVARVLQILISLIAIPFYIQNKK